MGAGLELGLGGGTRGVGKTQRVWQFADCELQDIMQFVTVEVTGVESPVKGGTTFGVVAVCADTPLCALGQIAAAATRIATAKRRMISSASSEKFRRYHSGTALADKNGQ